MRRRLSPTVHKLPNTRYHIFIIPLILSLIGCYFIFEASALEAAEKYKDSLYFLKEQLVSLGISITAMFIVASLRLELLRKYAFHFMALALILLIAVLIPGIGQKVGGARRWIHLPYFSMQPVEFAKFAVLTYCSAWFVTKERKRFVSFMMLTTLLFGLVMLQPDMGSAAILGALMIGIYVVSGNDLRPLIILLLPIIGIGLVLILTEPYRMNRVKALFDPTTDPLGVSYHINQIFIALQSGGLWGAGIGLSRQKFAYLPEAHTDSIFAIIAEDTGFFGSGFIIFLYLLFLYSIYILIHKTTNAFARLIASGVLLYFGLHIIVNLASIVGMFPLTGVPLPFLSFGGTSLLLSFMCVGLLLNIAKNHSSR